MTKILVCTAGPDAAKEIVKEIVKVVKYFEAEVIVLNILPHGSPIPLKELEKRGKEATEIIVDKVKEEGFKADYKLKFADDISRGIVESSEEENTNLIVMGVGKKPSWFEFTRKDITEEVIHNSSCPVLTLPKELKCSPFSNQNSI